MSKKKLGAAFKKLKDKKLEGRVWSKRYIWFVVGPPDGTEFSVYPVKHVWSEYKYNSEKTPGEFKTNEAKKGLKELEMELGIDLTPFLSIDKYDGTGIPVEFNAARKKKKIAERAGRLAEQLGINLTPIRRSTSLDAIEANFQSKVRRASKFSNEELERRVASAKKKPERISSWVECHKRSEDVVELVLRRANGICEGCGEDAPFRRKTDDEPYLEVHHVKRLADGGEDTVENAIALCPNCHRKRHYG